MKHIKTINAANLKKTAEKADVESARLHASQLVRHLAQ